MYLCESKIWSLVSTEITFLLLFGLHCPRIWCCVVCYVGTKILEKRWYLSTNLQSVIPFLGDCKINTHCLEHIYVLFTSASCSWGTVLECVINRFLYKRNCWHDDACHVNEDWRVKSSRVHIVLLYIPPCQLFSFRLTYYFGMDKKIYFKWQKCGQNF
jgi:hypothetical protein